MRTATLLIRDPLPRDAHESESLPALHFVLQRGRADRLPDSGPIAWLGRRFGLASQPDCPLAPVLAGSLELLSGYAYWLCADPVHVDVHPQQVSVVRSGDLALSQQQSMNLCAALDRHFASAGIRAAAFDRNRWLLAAAAPARLDTAPPDAKDRLRRVTVSGEHASRWNAFLTEAQMLLHALPENAGREADGQLPVNSLYLWGAGTAAEVQSTDSLFASDDPLTRALVRAGHGEAEHDLAGALERSGLLTAFSLLAVPASTESSVARRDALRVLESQWLRPALLALRNRRLDRVEVVLMREAEGMTLHSFTRWTFWPFWRGRWQTDTQPA